MEEETTWLSRCSVLCEATQQLLVDAVAVASEGEKAASTLSASAARFDSVAAALEEDLLEPSHLILELLGQTVAFAVCSIAA